MRYSLDCTICPFVQDPDNQEADLRVIEGDHWVATVRQDQEFLGTTFVTLRDHKESLESLTLEEDLEFIEIRNRLSLAQKRAFGATVINISCLMNNAYQDALPAPHVHYHFKPRYESAVDFRGDTFVDHQFGHYIKDKHPHPVSHNEGAAIAAMLRQHLPQ